MLGSIFYLLHCSFKCFTVSDIKEPSWIWRNFEFGLTVDQFLGYILAYLIISTFWMCLGSFYGLFYVPDFIKMCQIWTFRLFIRGFQRGDIVKDCWIHLFLTFLSSIISKEHMLTRFLYF